MRRTTALVSAALLAISLLVLSYEVSRIAKVMEGWFYMTYVWPMQGQLQNQQEGGTQWLVGQTSATEYVLR